MRDGIGIARGQELQLHRLQCPLSSHREGSGGKGAGIRPGKLKVLQNSQSPVVGTTVKVLRQDASYSFTDGPDPCLCVTN